MEIIILGAGCYNCQTLEANIFNALAELDIAADVTKVTEPEKIAEYGIGVPALLINGVVKVYGRVPQKEEIKQLLQQEKY